MKGFCLVFGAGGIRLPALSILLRASRPPARSPARPCAGFVSQGLRLSIVTGALRFESPVTECEEIKKNFVFLYFFYIKNPKDFL
jgi:hypothetical protein